MASGLGLPLPGVLAQYRVFPDYGLVTVPDYLSDEEAATLPIAACTAWMSIQGFQPLGSPLVDGDTVVLIQGTGGVSVSGLQIAKACGMKGEYRYRHHTGYQAKSISVIVTSSSNEKLDKARALGADYTINYRTSSDWHEEVLKITENRGADIIFECGGAQTLRQSFECVAFGGIISCIGYLSGKEDVSGNNLHTNVLALKRNVTLKGILNGPRDRLEEMISLYGEKQIRPVVDKVFQFDKAKEALQYLFNASHFGKVVIRVA